MRVFRFCELEDDAGYRLMERAGVPLDSCSLGDDPEPGAIYLAPGRLLTSEWLPPMRRAIRTARVARTHWLFYAPFALDDLSSLLECPGEFGISKASGTLVRWLGETPDDLPKPLAIAYAGSIRTSYRSGVLAVGEAGEPVLVTYRPSSTEGQLVVTTLLLASPNIRTQEAHRRALLRTIVERLARDSATTEGREPTGKPVAAVAREVLNTVILAVYCETDPVPTSVMQFVRERLGFPVDEEAVVAALQLLREEGVVTIDGTPDMEQVRESVVSRNLDSLARMLRDER